MDRMLYVAMTGAAQIMRAQAAVSHNLANVSTAGFRADLNQLRAMPVYGPGHPSRVYAMTERPGVDFAPGSVQTTGRDLDVAISSEGWLAVLGPDGAEAYTRAGDLQVDSNGLLSTGAGHPVLGNGGQVALPPHDKLEIGADGTISVHPLGQEGGAMVIADRLKLVRPDPAELVKGAAGLMRARDGEPFDPDAAVRVSAGALEGSNVNVVEGLVQMIALARQYETQVRMMKVAKEDDESTDALLRMS